MPTADSAIPGRGREAPGTQHEAAAALALLASGADDPGAGKLRAALGYVQSTAAELRPRGDWMSMYSYFSVSQALADQPDLVRPWYLAASTQLIAAQQADGSWSDPAGSGFASTAACLTLQLPRWRRASRGDLQSRLRAQKKRTPPAAPAGFGCLSALGAVD